MKINRLFLIVVFMLVLVLAACSSGASEETAAPEAEVIPPTATAVANVVEQPEEKEDEAEDVEQAPVEAPEVDGSEGVFETVYMVDNLDDYVLRVDDLPNDYKIVADGEQHLTNLKIINTVGEVDGKRYIAATTRIDGWGLELERVHKADLIPYTMYSEVVVFETAEGAQAAFGPDWFEAYSTEEDAREVTWIEDGCDIGDACVMYYFDKLDPTTELTTLQYEVAFVYKNVLAVTMGRGLDFDMKPDYVVDAAETLFTKIDSAPLAE